ncbi:spike base protein, RCAP_Rcc01079 family [Thalassolituus oleivorans]|uniref:spike base protein, RCAP_Rcc01079 family n=1 Tax=Thalassolituus oleivorans TaxID=187493 RepID=UPI0023F29596|nr:hypothetical protein [Thalassolituus oleivorans]
MFDKWKKATKTIDSVAESAFAITPSDANQLAIATRSLYIGTGGDLVVQLVEDTAPITFINVISGSILPIRVQKVLSTGTTATDLIGLN